MKKLSTSFPTFHLQSASFTDEHVLTELRSLLQKLEDWRAALVEVVNFNSVQFVSQNDQPTPAAGQMILWEDADAGGGQPTHYLVMNDGTSTVTFASEETV